MKDKTIIQVIFMFYNLTFKQLLKTNSFCFSSFIEYNFGFVNIQCIL